MIYSKAPTVHAGVEAYIYFVPAFRMAANGELYYTILCCKENINIKLYISQSMERKKRPRDRVDPCKV